MTVLEQTWPQLAEHCQKIQSDGRESWLAVHGMLDQLAERSMHLLQLVNLPLPQAVCRRVGEEAQRCHASHEFAVALHSILPYLAPELTGHMVWMSEVWRQHQRVLSIWSGKRLRQRPLAGE